MNDDAVDEGRRRVLTVATSVVGAIGAGFVAVPFLSAMEPSARTRAAGAPVEIDISKLEVGQLIRVGWRGRPVWVVRRSQESLDDLGTLKDFLRDPDSEESIQPKDASNSMRSIKPEIFLAIGICTHLGCSPTFRPDIAPSDLGSDWKGGFFCPCHGSRFDLAGRVYKSVPAPTNLEIPPYRYLSDTRIIVGEESSEEAV
ncbi:MAG: ubiquinol-cytochrome c reductase iron-sulfur subunit [Methylococcaceae bacterium]|nr:ubiquinol-cytochrome c reductase iron-sulfur subunit [Methylococcaceae bacterium]